MYKGQSLGAQLDGYLGLERYYRSKFIQEHPRIVDACERRVVVLVEVWRPGADPARSARSVAGRVRFCTEARLLPRWYEMRIAVLAGLRGAVVARYEYVLEASNVLPG